MPQCLFIIILHYYINNKEVGSGWQHQNMIYDFQAELHGTEVAVYSLNQLELE